MPTSTTSKQQLSHAILTMTLWNLHFNGLWAAHTTAAKIYKQDTQTLAEVIRLVEKLNAANQLTTTLTPFMVSMLSNDDRCFVCG